MSIQPQTKANEIQDSINLVLEKGRMLSLHSSEVAGWMSDIRKLEMANRSEALALRALVLHLAGDLPAALDALDQSKANKPLDRLVILSNYSKCREGQALYAQCCEPRTGNFSIQYRIAYAIGAFHKMAEFAREAERIGIGQLEPADFTEITMIDDLLNEFGVSDSAAGEVMEIAGGVLTDHGLIFIGPGPNVDVLDVPGQLRTVNLTYRLPATPSQALDLYLKFIMRMFEREQTIPNGMHISFEGVAT